MKQIIVIIIVLASLTFFLSKLGDDKERKKKSKKMFTPKDAEIAIKEVAKRYGQKVAQDVERIMRLETGHFKSVQYQKTGSAGMEVGKWSKIPKDLIENYTVTMSDADKSDGDDEFIVWKSVTAFAAYLAEYIQRHKGNWARWNAIDPVKQEAYRKHVSTIRTHFA